MPRAISLFEKKGEALINRIEFMRDDLEFFRMIFGYPENDPMLYMVYRINRDQNQKIYERFGVSVDIDNYDCSVEYYE